MQGKNLDPSTGDIDYANQRMITRTHGRSWIRKSANKLLRTARALRNVVASLLTKRIWIGSRMKLVISRIVWKVLQSKFERRWFSNWQRLFIKSNISLSCDAVTYFVTMYSSKISSNLFTLYSTKLFTPVFNQIIHPVFNQIIHPVFIQIIHPVFNQLIHPVFNQLIHPVFNQIIHPVFIQIFHPVFNQLIHPIFIQLIHPNFYSKSTWRNEIWIVWKWRI